MDQTLLPIQGGDPEAVNRVRTFSKLQICTIRDSVNRDHIDVDRRVSRDNSISSSNKLTRLPSRSLRANIR